jgi:hypothetical protein
VYGLASRQGEVRYEAHYRFERAGSGFLGLGGSRVTTISFTRQGPATGRVTESLVIDPGRLPRGSYRLVVTIVDLEARTHTSSAVLNLELR